MNDATRRFQRQLCFPPIARRCLAAANRFVAAGGPGPDGVTLARQRMARWLRRVARRQADRIRLAGRPTTMTWWAADCMEAEIPAIHWDWLAGYWVARAAGTEPPPIPAVEDDAPDVRLAAAYLANAALLVSRAATGNEPRHVLERRVAVMDLELARWRDAERAAREAEATT
jgi:hypothetical protein